MRWRQSRRSQNVEDRRGQRASQGGARIGGGAGLLLLVVVVLLGGDPRQVLQLLVGGGGGPVMTAPSQPRPAPENDEAGQFLSAVLGMTEDVWGRIFQSNGTTYQPPTLAYG